MNQNNYSLTLTAKLLGAEPRHFIKALVIRKYIYYGIGKTLQPYSQYLQKGLFIIKEYISPINGHRGLQTLISEKGVNYFKEKMESDTGFRCDVKYSI